VLITLMDPIRTDRLQTNVEASLITSKALTKARKMMCTM